VYEIRIRLSDMRRRVFERPIPIFKVRKAIFEVPPAPCGFFADQGEEGNLTWMHKMNRIRISSTD